MKKDREIDRTLMFQGLERELQPALKPGTSRAVHLAAAENDLRPFFENPKRLRQILAVSSLAYEHSFLCKTANEPWVKDTVLRLLREFREARGKQGATLAEIWRGWMNSIDKAINNTAGVALLQGEANLEPSVQVKNLFRSIGDMLEGSLLPFVRIRLKVNELAGKRPANRRPVEQLSFGDIIEELSPIDTIYKPPPWLIPVSQWRNIACHNSYQSIGDNVRCTYGISGRARVLNMTLSDLFALAVQVDHLCYTHKVAIELFAVDNIDQIISPKIGEKRTDYAADCSPVSELTAYTKDGALAFGLVVSGFSIVLARQSSDYWYLALVDNQRRSEQQVKEALHDSCVPYSLFEHPVGIRASVKCGDAMYCFSFMVSFAQDGAHPLDGVEVRRLDEHYGLVPKQAS